MRRLLISAGKELPVCFRDAVLNARDPTEEARTPNEEPVISKRIGLTSFSISDMARRR